MALNKIQFYFLSVASYRQNKTYILIRRYFSDLKVASCTLFIE